MDSGLIFINKKSGVTSFDALRVIKRALGTGKAGHTGTLDKFASGLLIVLTGKALKLSKWFSHCDKKYQGRIHLGTETDTLDPEGKIIGEAALPSLKKVEDALPHFTGVITQSPPVYSAIHINGKRASDLARSGVTPEMRKRQVTIYHLELLSWHPPFADIFVHCSSGTYIRSLARDIALAAGSRGYLDSLLRTNVAGFSLEMAADKQGTRDYKDGFKSGEGRKDIHVLPVNKSVISSLGMPRLEVTREEARYIFHGKPLDIILKNKLTDYSDNEFSKSFNNAEDINKPLAVFHDEELIAVLEKSHANWKYGCVISRD